MRGWANGFRMDAESALIWSAAHFTGMDNNYPACTPREGYPVEIQALWIRLLRQLEQVSDPEKARRWAGLANQARASFESLCWLEARGYYAASLVAGRGHAAATARADDALRSNCLFAVSLG